RRVLCRSEAGSLPLVCEEQAREDGPVDLELRRRHEHLAVVRDDPLVVEHQRSGNVHDTPPTCADAPAEIDVVAVEREIRRVVPSELVERRVSYERAATARPARVTGDGVEVLRVLEGDLAAFGARDGQVLERRGELVQ